MALLLCAACSTHHLDAPPLVGSRRTSGQLVDVHPEESRLELSDAGRRFSVFYTGETLVKSGTGELGIVDLRPGDRLVISFENVDDSRARLVTLAGPTRTPAPATTKEPENP